MNNVTINDIRKHLVEELNVRNADDIIRLWNEDKIGVRSVIEACKMLDLPMEERRRVSQALQM